MAPPVYTTWLFHVSLTPGHTFTAPPVPTGHVYVVVDIQARMVNDNNPAILGCIWGPHEDNVASWQAPPFGRRNFHWKGRQAVPEGVLQQFICEGSSGGLGQIDLSVTVYDLTLP